MQVCACSSTAAAVNWVTQSSFDPPLIVVAVKADSGVLQAIAESRLFAMNFQGKGQQGQAFAFFKPTAVEDGTINGEPYCSGSTGAPILEDVPARIECRLDDVIARGDHHIVIGEVVDAHLGSPVEGRPDEAGLHMNELGENVFYGG
jgi:flavin reductase (DIM6/NTAB) family NADH-FMN oxidoreductase RutF